MTRTIVPAILCGGSGTRLWPLSRAARPKQFHPLISDRSLLAETIARNGGAPGVAAPVLIAGESMRDLLEQDAPAAARLVLEPEGRNTAPAAALAALAALETAADAIVLMLPSDHHVGDLDAYRRAIAAGASLAADDRIVTFGITPTGPHTGYGYITAGAPLGAGFAVRRFVEKPELEPARALIAAGGSYWNSGIYMFGARFYLEELGRLQPAMRAQAEAAWRQGRAEGRVQSLDGTAWRACPSDSIDYAVAEKTDRAAVVPVSMAWDDVGSWAALDGIARTSASENVTTGDVITIDASGCYARTGGRTIALVGVQDLVVVDTPDALLIIPRDRTQDVKKIVETLKARKRTDLL